MAIGAVAGAASMIAGVEAAKEVANNLIDDITASPTNMAITAGVAGLVLFLVLR